MKWLILLACVAVVGCGSPSGDPPDASVERDAGPVEVGDPLTWALDEAGPFRVGYQRFEHTYRPDGLDADRTIAVHVWYPTLDTSGAPAMYGGLVRDRDVLTDATPAEPAHASGRYPVHVYSHGHRGFAGVSAFLHRRLASHGWITIAPDHTGNTLLDNVDPRPVALYYLRSLDVRAAVDAFVARDELDADTDHLLLSGHSFGTHTAWASAGATFDVDRIESESCTTETPCTEEQLDVFRAGVRDPRIVAAVPMAGIVSSDWFGETGHTTVSIPLLAMTGSADANTMSGAEVQFERASALADFTWIDVEGACHEFFGLGCDDPAGEQERVVATYVLALGRRHVLGDQSVTAVLEGTSAVSDRVTLRRGE
ncbi:alpha/beta hydrolase family protein [Sandaracinus amylolyticus]|uniref:alpha/beta hydrolase family protein n=1 Tax=Sandaracinus amylolyticus TaxID=927083 RepID=UPI0012ED70D7|nr:hypothetical protein [Sandaracinus amylolyticus]